MQITLKAARINAGFTQKQVAERLGISRYTLWNWESGKSFPNAMQIMQLLQWYHVRYEDILFSPTSNAFSVT